ncbi:MAG: hypothetical protein ABI761_09600 [Saprospiraceae bacterium]
MAATESALGRYIKTKYITWTKWEYMPMTFTNIPVFICYLYYSIKSGSISFFKAANPGIPMGGAFGVSKMDMMKNIPRDLLPGMFLSLKGETIKQLKQRLIHENIKYPLILKPDIGERGFFVKKILSETELDQYLKVVPCDMIIQEFIDLPLEYTLSFNVMPGKPESLSITSICKKGFMQITGDGIHTGRDLMAKNPRYYLQIPRFEKQGLTWLNEIIPKGITMYPEPVGNHNRGTAFYDQRYLIAPELIDQYRSLCLGLDRIYIGRFDIKARSEADFLHGNIKIMELNGVFGEPVHVYDPAYSPIQAYKDLFRQWNLIYRISDMNKQGDKYSIKKGYDIVRHYFMHKKSVKSIK